MVYRLLLLAALLAAGCSRTATVSPGGVSSALDWAQKQGVKRGTVASLPPPQALVQLGARGPVDVAHLEDGRYCVLLKTELFGHDHSNFRGVLACTGSLRGNELVAAHGTYPPSVSFASCALPGCGVFEELYIDRQRDDRTFDVSFDLN